MKQPSIILIYVYHQQYVKKEGIYKKESVNVSSANVDVGSHRAKGDRVNMLGLTLSMQYAEVKRSMLTCQTKHYHSIISTSLWNIRQANVIMMFDSYNVLCGKNSQTLIAVNEFMVETCNM